MIRIAIDAMGGDNAPRAIVEGAVRALQQGFVQTDEIILVGLAEEITHILDEKHLDMGITVVDARQVVGMNEPPVDALRRKKDSSILKTIALLKDNTAQAVISAGNTGAVVAGSIFLLGMLKGIRRPGIGILFQTLDGPCTLIDVGANVNCKPIQLYQYGLMASNYMKQVMGIKNARVALINVGEEDEKGTSLLKETRAIFEESPLNFIGNIEGQDLFQGRCDVAVCDGFVGNVILKVSEGLGAYFQTALTNFIHTEAGLNEKELLSKLFKDILSRLDYAEYGGAPLLGVNGNVFICHGRSDPKAISNAIRIARISADQRTNEHISADLGNA
ncbi:MAG: phosphate acyltransferase PlsX [Planctomycetota bacterium]